VILHHPSFAKEAFMDDREELRRLIDVIEKGSGATRVEQAVDDLKTFANTASFLANKFDGRLKAQQAKPKAKGKAPGLKAPMPIPKSKVTPAKPSQSPEPASKPVINAISTGISQADFDCLRPQSPQAPISSVTS
jgi:DNA invertase Pin-like site-specific DNA recombinase